jgi:hypothetical protein
LNSNQRAGHRSSRLTFAIVAGALLILASAVSVAAASPDSSKGTSITNPGPGGGTPPEWGDGATRIKPDASVRSLSRQAWDHITVSPNGKKLVVYFWMGVQDCYGLGRVDVVRRDGQVTVKLWTGIQKGAEHMICIDLAQLYKTVVHLDRPIIGGGIS